MNNNLSLEASAPSKIGRHIYALVAISTIIGHRELIAATERFGQDRLRASDFVLSPSLRLNRLGARRAYSPRFIRRLVLDLQRFFPAFPERAHTTLSVSLWRSARSSVSLVSMSRSIPHA